MVNTLRLSAAAALLVLLAGCSGSDASTPVPGGGAGTGSTGTGGGTGAGGGAASGWSPGVFAPSSGFAARCENPRTGTDPLSGAPYPDAQGSELTENNWLRSWSHELYLWYDEIVDEDPGLYSTPAYFDTLKTFATTASGTPKDRFHFTVPTDEWQQLIQSGVSSGYGVQWAFLSDSPPRDIRVAFTEPGSPASSAPANLERGARLVMVDGVDAVSASDAASISIIESGLFPSQTGETHSFTVRDPGATADRTFTISAETVTSDPVQNVGVIDTPTGRIGYLLFNDHLATAERELVDAVNTLATAGIDDLVLDLRYNGGGFLFIASELAYMIAGTVPTAGRTFELIEFNDKHTAINPVTGLPLTPVPFFSSSLGFSVASGQSLPTLDLPRVFVLTGGGTCSASESIINGLRGVDVEVVQIGSTTCGKPYGFYPTDNCGTTYFSIQFRGVNDKGFGDYADGFSPANAPGTPGTALPGCSVADDFDNPLGDPNEARLAAALAFRDTGACPAPTGSGAPGQSKALLSAQPSSISLPKPGWRDIRLLEAE